MKEYDKLEKGAANSNRSTSILQRQLESNDPNKKIIITTIQKLSIFIKNNKNHPIYDKEVVLIFDECHRSQFGSMHTAVIKNFKNIIYLVLPEHQFLQLISINQVRK